MNCIIMPKSQFEQKKINQIHLLDTLIIIPYNHVVKRNNVFGIVVVDHQQTTTRSFIRYFV
jgi:hypothetical protein